MRFGRWGRMVALGGVILFFLAACDRGGEVSIITATPICPVAVNATSASGTVSAPTAQSLTLVGATNSTILVHYVRTTRFNRLDPLTGTLKAGMHVQVLVDSSNSGIAQALTVIQQPADNPQTTCTASQGGVPGVVGTVAAVRADGQQFTLTDADGKQYLLAISATTSITQLDAATANDIAAGERVLVSGIKHGTGIDASQIIISTNAI